MLTNPTNRNLVTEQLFRLAREIEAGRLSRTFVDQQIVRLLLTENGETKLVAGHNLSLEFTALRTAVSTFSEAYEKVWGEWSQVVADATPRGQQMCPYIFGGLLEGRMSGTYLRIAIDGELTQP